ncbi:MAG: GDP-mannose pyrophosphatase [Conexibacter sp.]|nr:GDP-mannose pyrophosphatase [Conexibacter sp.]
MNRAALAVFRAGHLPVTGEALALPLIEQAGSAHLGHAAFDELFHPLSRRLVARCDGVLRIGRGSTGADEMVALARAHGKTIFTDVAELPPVAT